MNEDDLQMLVTYDPEADALYVKFRDKRGETRTREIDDHRIVDEDDEGVLGIELLFVSRGVTLDGLPRAEELREMLRSLREIPQPA